MSGYRVESVKVSLKCIRGDGGTPCRPKNSDTFVGIQKSMMAKVVRPYNNKTTNEWLAAKEEIRRPGKSSSTKLCVATKHARML